MGVNYHTYLILGVECRKSDFMKEVDNKVQCKKGHEFDVEPGMRHDEVPAYCPKDGTKVELVSIMGPTDGFKRFVYPELDGAADDWEDVWELWNKWEEDTKDERAVALMCVDRVIGSRPDHRSTYCLGVVIAENVSGDGSEVGNPGILLANLSSLLVPSINMAAHTLGIQSEIKLYLSTYVSC